MTALENVAVPLELAGTATRSSGRRASCCGGRPRPTARPLSRRNCRAASSSASPSPARWSPSLRCCWPTSRPAISTTPTGAEIADLLFARAGGARHDDGPGHPCRWRSPAAADRVITHRDRDVMRRRPARTPCWRGRLAPWPLATQHRGLPNPQAVGVRLRLPRAPRRAARLLRLPRLHRARRRGHRRRRLGDPLDGRCDRPRGQGDPRRRHRLGTDAAAGRRRASAPARAARARLGGRHAPRHGPHARWHRRRWSR